MALRRGKDLPTGSSSTKCFKVTESLKIRTKNKTIRNKTTQDKIHNKLDRIKAQVEEILEREKDRIATADVDNCEIFSAFLPIRDCFDPGLK